MEQEDFLTHLRAYGEEWFLDNSQTPGGTHWLAEAMENRTLTLVTDDLYTEHRNQNMSGVGWIIQGRATGKGVQGSLVERSTSAGSYRGELLGMLAVRVFLIVAESLYGSSTEE